MTDFIDAWQSGLPYPTPNNELPAPLNGSVDVPRDPTLPDASLIDWQEMLCSETDEYHPAVLNLANTESDFLDTLDT